MFWGLVLEPGKRYSTQVEKSFHLSMAALDCATVKNNNEILKVVVHIGDEENLLCSLSREKGILQVKLDLNFLVGDDITFECKGSGIVYLSDDLEGEDDMVEEEIDESEEDLSTTVNTKQNKAEKRKSDLPQPQQNKKKKGLEENSESSDDLGEEGESSEAEDEEEEEDDEESDEEIDEESEEEASSDEEQTESLQIQKTTPESLTKKQKKQQQKQQKQQQKQQQASPQKQTPGKQNKPLVNGVTPNQQQSGKKENKKGQTPPAQSPGQNATATPKQKGNEDGTFKKRVIEGGVVVRDVKLGGGQPVKNGNMVSVYYTGRIKSNNKIFDQVNKGDGFKFKLGKGEVIKGWDIGVNGMKVGGKRVITCPANVAYGKKGSLPTIPPNSTLIFEVEMKAVN